MLEETLLKVNRKWNEECLKVTEPLSKLEVIEKFTNYGVFLAQDALEVFSTIGGIDENDMDSECLTFWTVEKILRELDFNAEKVYFADFLIDSHHYYFECKNAESSAIYVSYDENDKHKIADSFEEFFELYLTDIKGLFP